MSESAEKTFFVRRRDRSFGPFTAKQILSGNAAKKFQETDLISESSDGPWISIARHFLQSQQDQVPEADIPPVQQNQKPAVMPIAVETQFTQKTPAKPSSPWKYAVVGILALFAVGIVGFLGLAACFFVAVIFFGSSGNRSETASTNEARSTIEDSTAQNSGPANGASGGETESGDDLTKTLSDLQAALEGLKKDSGGESQGESPDSNSPAASDYSELSEEHRALSPKEATELAMKYVMNPAEREANGRTALLLLQKAADAGEGSAMYFLFLCYFKGWGISEDQAKGLVWLQKSAETNNLPGMYAYSDAIRRGMYEGLGESDAQIWLDRCASQGHAPAINEKKGQNVRTALGFFGALAAASGSESSEGEGEPVRACNAISLLGRPCDCDGFQVFYVDSKKQSQCQHCLHEDYDHNIK